MSSNIKTKKLIYGFNKYDQLPYQSSQMIDYGIDNQYVNMVSLNNTYGQCVDNDMFIAKRLMNKASGNDLAGPKLITDQHDISQLPNGAKYFSAAGDSSIMQKNDKTFQETLTKCTDSALTSVNFIHSIDVQSSIICTPEKTYLTYVNDITGKNYVPTVVVQDDNSRDVVVTAVVQYGRYKSTLFAANVAGKKPGLYWLDTSGTTYQFKLLYETSENDTICAVSTDDESQNAAFATHSKVYLCKVSDRSASNVRAVATFSIAIGTGDVCALIARKNKTIVFTTTGNAYDISYTSEYVGFLDASVKQISDNDIVVNDIVVNDGVEYLATSQGLALMKNNSVQVIDDNFMSEVKHLEVDDLGQVWCGDSAGRILMSPNPSTVQLYCQLPAGNPVSDFKIIDNVKIVVTSSYIMYEKSHGNFYNVSNIGNLKNAKVLTGFSSNFKNIYAAGIRSNKLDIVNATLNISHGEEDYNYIDGMSQISSFAKTGYSVEVAAMVDFDGKKNAFVNCVKSNDAYSLRVVLDANNSIVSVDSGDYVGRTVNGVIKVSSNELYVFATNIVFKYTNSNTKDSLVMPNELLRKKIVGCQMTDGIKCLMTLSSAAEGFQMAYVSLEDIDNNGAVDKIDVIDIITTGVQSNIVEHNGDILAFAKDGNASKISSFYVANQIETYDFSYALFTYEDIDAFQNLVNLYKSEPVQIVNNMSYRVNDSLTYRRADYVIPLSGNVSAVQSFTTVLNDDDDPTVVLKAMQIDEINNTGDVVGIDYAYDTDRKSGTCIVTSDGKAKYTFQLDSAHSKILNPSTIFIGALERSDNVVQAIAASFAYSNSTGHMTTYEICDNGKLKKVDSTSVSGSPPTVTTIAMTGEPVMLCKAHGSSYVLVRTSASTYRVKKISGTSLTDVGAEISETAALKAFKVEYDTEFSSILNYLGSGYDPSLSIDRGNNFADYADAVTTNGYTYSTSTHDDISDWHICVVFDSCQYVANKDASSSQAFSKTAWDNADVTSVMSFNQTCSGVDNALFTCCMCGSDVEVPLMFKTSITSDMCIVSEQQKICGEPAPADVRDVDFIGKDVGLDCTMLAQSGSLSAFIGSSMYVTPAPLNTDIHLIQSNNLPFSSQKSIVYATYDSSTNTYNVEMMKFNDTVPKTLMTSYTPIKLNVLNSSNQLVHPLMSYESSLETLKYETINNVAASVAVTKHIDSPDFKGFALDATNNGFVYAANGTTIHRVDLRSSSGSDSSINCPLLSAIAFPEDNFGGNDLYAYAVLSAASATSSRKAVALNSNGVIVNLDDDASLEKTAKESVIGILSFDSFKYTLYCAQPSNSFAVQFSGFGLMNAVTFDSNMKLDTNERANAIAQDNYSSYVIQTQHSIYTYNGNDIIDKVSRVYQNTQAVKGMLKCYDMGDSYSYFSNMGNTIISSFNLKSWGIVVRVGTGSSTGSAYENSFEMLNPYVLMIGKTNGSDNGLYYTYYDYSVENNTMPFTAESAYYAYYDNRGKLDQINSSQMSAHVKQLHESNSSDMKMVNSYMDVNFELSNFMKMKDETDISNDYIDQIIIGNNSDDNVIAYSCNTTSSMKWVQLTCNYIAKCWKSGMTDLYIYLPTTNTYYIPHIEGASQCNGYNELVMVNGRNLQSNVIDNVTSVRVNIVSSYFTVDTLVENTVKVNSLPLRIFKDDTNEDDSAATMFHSFVCPSVAKDFTLDDAHLGYYAFNYYCFGSDAQAIKLSFFNKSPNYGRKYKTVIYHANGGQLAQFPGMKSIKQRIYEGDSPVQMYWEIFTKDGSFFTGWAQSKNALDGNDEWKQGTMISYSSMRKTTLTLYACWVSYNFSNNDTTITIQNTEAMDYTIAEISIDPNASIPNNPSLGNKLIIDYGD